MRVVLDGRMILPHMTGVGRYLFDLVPALLDESSLINLELWIQRDLSADHPVWDLAGDRCVLRTLSPRHFDLSSQWRLPVELVRSKPDLFHCPHFNLPWGVPGKIVSTIHDLKYIVHPEFFPRIGRIKRLAVQTMMTYTCWRSQLVIVDSRNTAKDLLSRLRVSENKICIVPLGVDERFFQKVSIQQIQRISVKYKLTKPFLLFVGERRPHKNLTGLINVFNNFLHQASTPYHLVIAGKSYSDYQEPERIVKKLSLNEKVIFIDGLPDSDLPALYQMADVFVFLSLYEGFGLPVLEAMASGTPVVAANKTSLPEVVGNAGILIDLDQPESVALALAAVITGGEQREKVISAGLEQVRQFTWEDCARQTLEVYKSAVSS